MRRYIQQWSAVKGDLRLSSDTRAGYWSAPAGQFGLVGCIMSATSALCILYGMFKAFLKHFKRIFI